MLQIDHGQLLKFQVVVSSWYPCATKLLMNINSIERFHVTPWPPCWCPLNSRILVTFYCLVHQHGRPVLCLLCLLGLSENILYKTIL